MIKPLLKKQLLEMYRGFFFNVKTGKSRSKLSSFLFIALYAFLLVGVIAVMFAGLAFSICAPFSEMGLDWLYFTLFALLAVMLGVIGSVFTTYTSLYRAKDNDLLLSLPIPVRSILFARLLGVYLTGLIFCACVLLPAGVVYFITVSLTPASVCGSLLLLLCVSVFVLILSCLLGWLVAKISNKLKHKSFLTVLLSLLFLALYYVFYFQINELLQKLLKNAEQIGSAVKGAAYPLYLVGRAGAGDGIAMLLVAVVHAVLLALTVHLLSRSFLRLATSTGVSVRTAYRADRSLKGHSIKNALFLRELRRFTASSNYMLNCGLSTILLPVAAVALLIKGEQIRSVFTDALGMSAGVGFVLITGGMCMLASMNMITAPSVSLEGKTIWLIQSLPVPPQQALYAKLKLHLLLTEPPLLFCSVCAVIALQASPVAAVLMVLLPAAFALFSACLGLFLNLKHPNLNWTNETTPIKQSLCVLLTMFSGAVYGLLMVVGYFLIGVRIGAELWLSAFTLLSLLLSLLLLRWLSGRGSKIFAEL